MAFLKSASLSSRMSLPSSRISPCWGSYRRTQSLRIVLFPEPFSPTMTCIAMRCKYFASIICSSKRRGRTYTELPGVDLKRYISQGIVITTWVSERDVSTTHHRQSPHHARVPQNSKKTHTETPTQLLPS